MKVAIYSGMFDPFTNGHLWIVNEAKKMFDDVRVVIGPNPSKQPWFTPEQRLDMLKSCLSNVTCDITNDNIVSYIDRTADKEELYLSDFTIIRGIRNSNDLEYEAAIWQNTKAWLSQVDFLFLTPPANLGHISSSWIKELIGKGRWHDIKESVPEPVYHTICKYDDGYLNNWLVTTPQVASIFETTTVGFAPMPDEFGEVWPKKDDMYYPNESMERARQFIKKSSDLGLLKFANEITAQQVRKTLDPFPVDVVSSEKFFLKEISVYSVKPLGDRFLSSSRSIGPIIVDSSEPLMNSEYADMFEKVGPHVVIEGKHRLLDARARNEDTILAWVGDKIIDNLGSSIVSKSIDTYCPCCGVPNSIYQKEGHDPECVWS